MRRVLIYPYHKRMEWLFELEDNNSIFRAIKLKEENCPNNCNGRIKEEDEFEQELAEASILWIVSSEMEIDFETCIIPKVKRAVKDHIAVLVTRSFDKYKQEILNKLIPEDLRIEGEFSLAELEDYNFIYDIDVPVVYVVGVSKKINSTEQLIKIKRQFEERQYKVILFSDSPEISLFDGGYYLSMMKNGQKSPRDRSVEINHFIKQKEVMENPDLIIIGLMNGAISLGNDIIEDFGIDVYSTAQVVRPDCVILNLFYGEYQPEMLEELGKELQRIIGEEVDFYNITDQVMDSKESDMIKEVCTFKVEQQKVQNVLDKLSKSEAFYLQKEGEYKRLSKAVIDRLSEYAEVISM